MSQKLRIRLLLGGMMFFQYAAWGAWAPVLGATLADHMKASGSQIGAIFDGEIEQLSEGGLPRQTNGDLRDNAESRF